MITAQVESFENCLHELSAIFPKHWEELALFKDRMPLRPQYGEYLRREQIGQLFLATVRWNGKIVGYYTAQVLPGFHYGETLTATMDMVYIIPEARDKGLIMPLMKCVQRELKRRGAQVWYMGFKSHNPLGMAGLLKAFDFIPADTYYAKWLDK